VILPGRIGAQKVTASFGRFYQQLPLFITLGLQTPRYEVVTSSASDPRLPGWAPPTLPDWRPSPKVRDLRGEHLDELTVGYTRDMTPNVTLSVGVIRRDLRAAYNVAVTPDAVLTFVLGNPGRGHLSFLPEPRREYTGFDATLHHRASAFDYVVTYVLSRSYGNYTGLFNSDAGIALPQNNFGLQLADQAQNAMGLLPNDRTHVVKAHGTYRFGDRLTAGTFLTLASGTPRTELGASRALFRPLYVSPRGSGGRTPSIFDANVRLAYSVGSARDGQLTGRVIVDGLNLGFRRKPVRYEQYRYRVFDAATGSHSGENPLYREPVDFQPPMAFRIGLELTLTR
jgi:hypothetical protein